MLGQGGLEIADFAYLLDFITQTFRDDLEIPLGVDRERLRPRHVLGHVRFRGEPHQIPLRRELVEIRLRGELAQIRFCREPSIDVPFE